MIIKINLNFQNFLQTPSHRPPTTDTQTYTDSHRPTPTRTQPTQTQAKQELINLSVPFLKEMMGDNEKTRKRQVCVMSV